MRRRIEVIRSQPPSKHLFPAHYKSISSLTIKAPTHAVYAAGVAHLDFRATTEYIRKRGTFASVSEGPADLAMKLTARLSMVARGPYVYHVRLQADMGTVTEPIKSYDVEQSATGSSVRWITASDRDPIEAALQLALEDLLANIESDRSLYLVKEPVRGSKP
jgi:hypothetical protein